MRQSSWIVLIFVAVVAASLAPVKAATRDDWLITPLQRATTLTAGKDAATGIDTLTLSNGLVSRVFGVPQGAAAWGTVDFTSEVDPWALVDAPRSLLRAVTPEARVVLDGVAYTVGGLEAVPAAAGAPCISAYLNRSACAFAAMSAPANATTFRYSSHATRAPTAPYPWTPGTRGSPADVHWPPLGLHVSVNFTAPASAPPQHAALVITVHYEMYDGHPFLAKSVSVAAAASPRDLAATPLLSRASLRRGGAAAGGAALASARATAARLAATVEVVAVDVEWLATNFPYAPSMGGAPYIGPVQGEVQSLLHVQTDQAHGAAAVWQTDVNEMYGAAEPVLNCTYTSGPGVVLGALPQRVLGAAAEFTSFRCLEVVVDSFDPERHGLSVRRLTKLLAPQTMENPMFFHLTDASPTGFRSAVDQVATAGFEMIIYSFGSGFNLENQDPAYLAQIAADVAYAKSKGIEVGGYDLIDLDRGHGGYGGNVGDQWDAVDPATGQLSANACFASGWYDKLHDMIYNFINVTGLSMLETDGPYGGGACAATNHSHHTGLSDSVYMQTQFQANLYAALREKNVFINQPDNYFFQGGSKTGMGYNEDQYNLPRVQDVSVSRAGMFEDTYQHTVTQGWMFVPLVDYHGGGAAAAFDPMTPHLTDYEWALAQYMGYGVAACYRGYRLYDTPQAQAVVTKWVSFYKKHRSVVTSDLIHLRRADMQGIDAVLHVAPNSTERGLAIFFNPTDSAVELNVSLPVYYTGISTTVMVAQEEAAPTSVAVTRDYTVPLQLRMPAMGITYFVLTSGDA